MQIEKQISFDDLVAQQRLSWADFLNLPIEQRKKKWEEFKSYYPEDAEYWEDSEGCNCAYADDGWCTYCELPCGVNPYLVKMGVLGMACMGMKPSQREEL